MEVISFQDSFVNRLQAWVHDDKARGDDADIHLDDGDRQACDVHPW